MSENPANKTAVSGGVYSKVYHFDSKADVEDYIRSLGIPATFYLPAVYMSNFVPTKSFRPSPNPPHAFTLAFPIPTKEKVMPLIWAEEDTGKFVKGILKHRDQLLGKRVLGAADYYSMEEMIQQFEEVKPEAGKGAQAVELTPEAFRGVLGMTGMPPLIAEELSQNFEMLAQCGYFDKADVKEDHAVSSLPG